MNMTFTNRNNLLPTNRENELVLALVLVQLY